MNAFNLTHPRAIARLYQGPLSLYIDALAAQLQAQDYAASTILERTRVVTAFSRWLTDHKWTAAEVDPNKVNRFVKHRQRQRSLGRCDRAALQHVIALLREKGVIPKAEPLLTTPAQAAVEPFRHYLLQQRGYTVATVRHYVPVAVQFLEECFEDRPIEVQRLTAKEVVAFIRHHAHDGSHSHAQHLGRSLRSYLRFLQYQGLQTTDLAAYVPKVASGSTDPLPSYLQPHQVNQLLAQCDRNTPSGQRDHAIFLLLARLGLRAGEVAKLTLDQINWEEGTISLCGKGGRWSQLPLVEEVGKAIARYLAEGRPACADRHVFIRDKAPRRAFAGGSSLSDRVRCALRKAGIDCARRGAHLLRHSLATQMLAGGATLFDIGQVLRHQQPDTTRLYARVDITALRGIALPWPGAEQ
jgi:site-specific recombinase XerD